MNDRHSHWQRTKQRNTYQLLVQSMTRNRHKGAVKMEYFRHSSANKKMDFDNLVSSTKNIMDAIVKAGVLIDDNQDILREVHYEHILLSPKVKAFTVIRLTDL